MADVVRNIPQVVKYKNGGKKKTGKRKAKKEKKNIKEWHEKDNGKLSSLL